MSNSKTFPIIIAIILFIAGMLFALKGGMQSDKMIPKKYRQNTVLVSFGGENSLSRQKSYDSDEFTYTLRCAKMKMKQYPWFLIFPNKEKRVSLIDLGSEMDAINTLSLLQSINIDTTFQFGAHYINYEINKKGFIDINVYDSKMENKVMLYNDFIPLAIDKIKEYQQEE